MPTIVCDAFADALAAGGCDVGGKGEFFRSLPLSLLFSGIAGCAGRSDVGILSSLPGPDADGGDGEAMKAVQSLSPGVAAVGPQGDGGGGGG